MFSKMRKEAIAHGYAAYNGETAVWEWVEPKPKITNIGYWDRKVAEAAATIDEYAPKDTEGDGYEKVRD